MLNNKEVWWSDPTGLILKHSDIIEEYHSELAKKAILFDYYKEILDLKELFVNTGKITIEPSVLEYCELLVLMGQVLSLSDRSVLSDALQLYATIGKELTPDKSQPMSYQSQTKQNVQEINRIALKK
jgi:hypothetical protein